MALGPTLLGGFVGAAVGAGLYVLVEANGTEANWFPLIIGLFTGVAVRKSTSSAHASGISYARGALTTLLALAAICGATYWVQSKIRVGRVAPNEELLDLIAHKSFESSEDDDPIDDDAAPVFAVERTSMRYQMAADLMTKQHEGFHAVQYVFIVLGGFIAYELGRGVDSKALPTHEKRDPEPLPQSEPESVGEV